MGGQHVTDLVTVFVKFIVDIQNRSARIAEHGINALFLQAFDENL
jgi:hypothetical protein